VNAAKQLRLLPPVAPAAAPAAARAAGAGEWSHAGPSRLPQLRPLAAPRAGALLISHPRLAAPGDFFHRKVLLLTSYGGKEPARGLVLNAPSRLSVWEAIWLGLGDELPPPRAQQALWRRPARADSKAQPPAAAEQRDVDACDRTVLAAAARRGGEPQLSFRTRPIDSIPKAPPFVSRRLRRTVLRKLEQRAAAQGEVSKAAAGAQTARHGLRAWPAASALARLNAERRKRGQPAELPGWRVRGLGTEEEEEEDELEIFSEGEGEEEEEEDDDGETRAVRAPALLRLLVAAAQADAGDGSIVVLRVGSRVVGAVGPEERLLEDSSAYMRTEAACVQHLPASRRLLRMALAPGAAPVPPARRRRLHRRPVALGGPIPGAAMLHAREAGLGLALGRQLLLAHDWDGDYGSPAEGALRAGGLAAASAPAPRAPRLFLGCSEWYPGQLEAELARGEWLVAEGGCEWVLPPARAGGGRRRRGGARGGAPTGPALWRSALLSLGGEWAEMARLPERREGRGRHSPLFKVRVLDGAPEA